MDCLATSTMHATSSEPTAVAAPKMEGSMEDKIVGRKLECVSQNVFEILNNLCKGKHTHLRLLAQGAVSEIKSASPRLLFFRISCCSTTPKVHFPISWQCIAKDRDGFLSPAEIGSLASSLNDGDQVRLAAFPEKASGDSQELFLHCVSIVTESFRVGEAAAETADPALSVSAEHTFSLLTIHDEVPCERTKSVDEVVAEIDDAEVRPLRSKVSGSRARPNNASRHQIFSNWLIETFGSDYLSRGVGVLDVAGGAGGVAFELSFRHAVPCTVIDPREIKATSKQRRAMRCRARYYECVARKADASPTSGEVDDAGEVDDTSSRNEPAPLSGGGAVKEWTAEASVGPPAAQTECEAAAGFESEPSAGALGELDSRVDAGSKAETGTNLGPDEGALPPVSAALLLAATEEGAAQHTLLPRQLCARFDRPFLTAHAALWSRVSVVIGLHPDEATEPIVDFALAHRKPFVVLPCCVFPKSNTHRMLRDGSPVLSHEQFCVYLQEKHPSIRRTRLTKMEGRNVLLYYIPDRMLSEDEACSTMQLTVCDACEE